MQQSHGVEKASEVSAPMNFQGTFIGVIQLMASFGKLLMFLTRWQWAVWFALFMRRYQRYMHKRTEPESERGK